MQVPLVAGLAFIIDRLDNSDVNRDGVSVDDVFRSSIWIAGCSGPAEKVVTAAEWKYCER